MEITNEQIVQYTHQFTTPEPPIVQELVKASEKGLEYTDMLSGRQVGMLLRMLAGVSGARRVLEVGTFTGYSALMIAGVLPEGGELITCELNDRYRRISEPYFNQEPYNRIIKQIMGDALETIQNLKGTFDFIFLDADKIQYPEYYRLARERINPGGLIIADNTLWGGDVLNPATEKAAAIHRMNQMIRDDEDVEQVMIPLRDGLTICRVNTK